MRTDRVFAEILVGFLIAAAALRHADDSNLVSRLKQRDPGVMKDLYDRYGRLAYSVIVRIVRDRGVAEDLLQEVFLRVWNRVHSFDGGRGALGPWLLTISRNQALDYIKSVEGRTWNSAASESEYMACTVNVEGEYLTALRTQQVRTAIEKLTEQQRRVVEMAYFEGLSQTEMAERIQQPLGTVKTWMRTALKILREELGAPVTV